MRSKIEGNSLTSKTCQALEVFRTSESHQIASQRQNVKHLSSRQDCSSIEYGLHLPAFSPNSEKVAFGRRVSLCRKNFKRFNLMVIRFKLFFSWTRFQKARNKLQVHSRATVSNQSWIGAKMIKQSIWPQALDAAEVIPVCRGLLKNFEVSFRCAWPQKVCPKIRWPAMTTFLLILNLFCCSAQACTSFNFARNKIFSSGL